MARKLEPFTLTTVLYHAFDCIAAGCTAAEIMESLEREGYVMNVPLQKKDVAVVDLCKQIAAVAERNPSAGAYYEKLVAAAKHAIEVDKAIEGA